MACTRAAYPALNSVCFAFWALRDKVAQCRFVMPLSNPL